jgi:hypothetical protein
MMTEGQGVSVAVDASWCEDPAPVEALGVSVAVDASWEEMLSLADCPVSQGGLADNGSDAVAPPVVCNMQGTVQGLLDMLDLVPLGFTETWMMMMMMMVFKCVHDKVVCYCSRSDQSSTLCYLKSVLVAQVQQLTNAFVEETLATT